MRKYVTLLALAPLLWASSAASQGVRYIIDWEHTHVLFRLDHLGFAKSLGWFGKVEGEIVFDAANPASSKVSARIGVDSVATNHAGRDAWIRSDKVLDAAKFATMTFTSTKVTVEGDKRGTIEGALTLRGVTKPVTLAVTFGKEGVNPINKKQTVGFSAQGRIKRSEFGVTAFLGPLGDDVDITIEIEAIKAE